jgi:1-deoxy-D-xylulose-5-phosphate synthase
MVVCSPMNEQELRNMMYTGYLHAAEGAGPISIRYPRGEGVMPEWHTPLEPIRIGQGRLVQDGTGVAILTLGHIGNYVEEAQRFLTPDGLHPAHYDMRFVKPLDEAMLHEVFTSFSKIVTVEDGCLQGGFGSAILEFAADHGYHGQVKRLGIPDRVVEHGEQLELHHECGFDPEGIAAAVRELVGSTVVL